MVKPSIGNRSLTSSRFGRIWAGITSPLLMSSGFRGRQQKRRGIAACFNSTAFEIGQGAQDQLHGIRGIGEFGNRAIFSLVLPHRPLQNPSKQLGMSRTQYDARVQNDILALRPKLAKV